MLTRSASSEHVSCEFDQFRVDAYLCQLRDTSNFANSMEELI